MNKVENVCQPGIIAAIEQFTLKGEDLRLFVVYTYYDKNEEPLYIGCSKDFYNAHYLNKYRLSYCDEIEYVGFVFLDNEDDMKDARKYYIRARNPKYNQRKCKDTPLLPGLDPSDDDFVVYQKQMERRWGEWLGNNDFELDDCKKCPYMKLFTA